MEFVGTVSQSILWPVAIGTLCPLYAHALPVWPPSLAPLANSRTRMTRALHSWPQLTHWPRAPSVGSLLITKDHEGKKAKENIKRERWLIKPRLNGSRLHLCQEAARIIRNSHTSPTYTIACVKFMNSMTLVIPLHLIVLVNSHQRWKQTCNQVCFHLWCELTL